MSDQLGHREATAVGDCAGCAAAREYGDSACLPHLPPDELGERLVDWATKNRPLVLDQATVDADLFRQIRAAAPHKEGISRSDWHDRIAAPILQRLLPRVQFPAIYCSNTHFTAGVDLSYIEFLSAAKFNGASFTGPALFHNAIFSEKPANFGGASFAELANFDDASFASIADFGGASFAGLASFSRASFARDASFDGASFARDATFDMASFDGYAEFDGASFAGAADLDGALFEGDASFARTSLAAGQVTIAAPRITVAGLRPTKSLEMRVGHPDMRLEAPTEVDLSSAECSEPTILAPLTAKQLTWLLQGMDRAANSAESEAERGARQSAAVEWWLEALPEHPAVRLVSLRRADVAGLALSDVDLSACRFSGAHHLDKLRIDGTGSFARPPARQLWPPSRWRLWSDRQVIAEEADWRADQYRRRGQQRWPGWEPPLSELVKAEPITAARVAGIYRALRKSREDAKDQPGAADFYYGEMEMRRHDRQRPRAERAILTAYWLISGYGLRASRALAALVLLIVTATAVLAAAGTAGVAPPLSLTELALYATGTATPIGSIDLPREATLTTVGTATRIGLRFAGPVLAGLALLALRGRVHR